jgi:SAM-dependent methyltransferase
MTELSVDDGYSKWAGSYDQPENPLIELESRCLATILPELSPRSVLDLGTGTGRHAHAFGQRGADVVGVDISQAMLAVAEQRRRGLALENVRFIQASIDAALPVPAAAFDLGICALALCHVEALERPIASLGRAVRPGGHVILTDLHPAAVAAGLGTLFSVGGTTYAIATVAHSVERYTRALDRAGLTGVRVEERNLGEVVSSPKGLPSAVARENWQNLPFCLVITARVPETIAG